MKLAQRQRELLKQLISNDFISQKYLLKYFDITLATLKTDIDCINNEMNSSSKILMDEKQNYYINNKEQFTTDNYYLADTLIYDNQNRFNEILGYLLNHKYTKLDDLEIALNLEKSTFLPYLNLVRNALKKFDLDLLSKPKYGYYLKGKEINIRYAFVFYFTLSKENINMNDNIYQFILNLIRENNLELSDTKMVQLYYYLKVSKERHNKSINNEEVLLNEILEIFNLNETEYKCCLKEYSINKSEFKTHVTQYLKKYNLDILLEKCHFSLYDYLLKLLLKKELRIHLNVVPNQLDSISKDSPVALFLAEKILDCIGKYDESDVYELASILYNEIVTRHYSYHKLRLLIVSTLNENCHSSLRYRLMNRYDNYIETIDSAHFYELSKELVKKYDYVLYFQKDGMTLPSYIENKYALDYFINYNDFTKMFEELIVPRFIYMNPFDCTNQIKKVSYSNLDELKQYTVEIYNRLGISVIFTKGITKTIYYSFSKIQKLDGKKLKEGFLFFIDVQNDMLALKMAENLIRLIIQSDEAKQYLLSNSKDVYVNLLHHRRYFVG